MSSDLEQARAIFARFPTPACAETLGWHLRDADIAAGAIEIGFEGKPAFCNPAGYVQGGFLAAMLDDTMGPAVLVRSNGSLFTPTIELKVSFISPASPGLLIGRGRIVHMGRSIAFLEGSLCASGGELIATATASARLVPSERLVGSR
jgi:uncharacterized protein (TIGR00369 family)